MDFIEQIQQAETAAQELKNRSQEESEKRILEAQENQKVVLKEEKERLATVRKDALMAQKSELKDLYKTILEAGSKEADIITQSAKKNLSKATKELISSL